MNPTLLSLTRSYQRALALTAARTGSAASRSLLAMTPLDDPSAALWVQQAASVVDAGRTAAAGLADAYYRAYGDVVGDPLAPAPVDFDLSNYRNGIPIEDVYMRSVIEARTAISKGMSFDEAMQLAARAAEARADTDVILSSSTRSLEIMRGNGVRSYRRVPDANACPFCLLISTRKYKANRLMPVHTKCHCTTAPIYGKHDPGGPKQTKAFKEATQGKGASVEETEIGPTIRPQAASA